MTVSQALEKLSAYEKLMFTYNHASGLMYYDGATVAPRGSADLRADTLGELARLSYALTTAPDTGGGPGPAGPGHRPEGIGAVAGL